MVKVTIQSINELLVKQKTLESDVFVGMAITEKEQGTELKLATIGTSKRDADHLFRGIATGIASIIASMTENDPMQPLYFAAFEETLHKNFLSLAQKTRQKLEDELVMSARNLEQARAIQVILDEMKKVF